MIIKGLRQTPDERLELNVIPLRIKELELMEPTKAVKKRLIALHTRQGTPPPEWTKAQKKAFVAPKFDKIGNTKVEHSDAVRLMTPNMYAGLLASKADVASGYGVASV